MDTRVPPFDLDAFLPYRLAVVAERLSTAMARRYRDEFGITIAEWRVLVHLADAGTVSVRDIQTRVAMEKSRVSRAAARLVAEGLVTKGPSRTDRRLVDLSLSPAGRALMARILPLATAYQAELETRLGDRLAPLGAALDALAGPDG